MHTSCNKNSPQRALFSSINKLFSLKCFVNWLRIDYERNNVWPKTMYLKQPSQPLPHPQYSMYNSIYRDEIVSLVYFCFLLFSSNDNFNCWWIGELVDGWIHSISFRNRVFLIIINWIRQFEHNVYTLLSAINIFQY